MFLWPRPPLPKPEAPSTGQWTVCVPGDYFAARLCSENCRLPASFSRASRTSLCEPGVSFKDTVSAPSADFHDYVVRNPSTQEISRSCSAQILEEQSRYSGNWTCLTPCTPKITDHVPIGSSMRYPWGPFPSSALTGGKTECLFMASLSTSPLPSNARSFDRIADLFYT